MPSRGTDKCTTYACEKDSLHHDRYSESFKGGQNIQWGITVNWEGKYARVRGMR